jgi:diguanylate cyclase (GGDEF)-like protein/PAS domain S-box-containing protein
MERYEQNEIQPMLGNFHPNESLFHRRRLLRILFIHRDATAINDCLRELKRGRFTVSSDSVVDLEQRTEQSLSKSYDVVVVEYPSPRYADTELLQKLQQHVCGIPVILLVAARTETIAELAAQTTFEYVEREHLDQLPMAVRRALNDKQLREELEEVRKALFHSQSLYRALADNPAYGVYRCDAEGKVLDVNQALVSMLGYESKEQLLAVNQSEIIPILRDSSSAPVCSLETNRIEPVEIEWKRKDGTPLKVKLSGRGVYDDHGNFAGHEIIAVDVTEQHALEDQLRHQASSDSLTGLANHRRLFEVLHAEICRSKRTGREFSLLLLDLDGLKKINDQFGHLAGDRALGRLGNILRDCCRSVDTAARHGGDEFAVILPETGVAAATLVVRRIFELLERDTEEPALSVCAGIASFPREADTIGTLLYAADRALYAMKENRVRLVPVIHGSDFPLPGASPDFVEITRDRNTILKREATHE